MNEPNKFSKYKKTMIRRGILVWIPTLLSAGSLLLFRFDWSPFPQRHMSDFMRGFQAGMVLGLLGCSLLALISTILTCRNPEKLRKAYVEETDERTQLISRKAFSRRYNGELFQQCHLSDAASHNALLYCCSDDFPCLL